MSDNLDQDIAAAVQAEVAKLPVTPDSVAAPKGINVKLGDNTFNFNDESDLNSRLGGYFSQQNNELQTAREELTRQRAEIEQFKAAPKPSEGSTLNEKDEFLQNFAKTFIEDPVAGLEMAFAKSKYAPQLNKFDQTITQVKTNQVGQTFRDTHPDYVATESNGKAMMEIMTHYQLPFTENALHLAYSEGLRSGRISNPQESQGNSNNTPSFSRNNSMPTIQRNNSQDLPQSYMDDIESLPADSIAAIVSKLENARR